MAFFLTELIQDVLLLKKQWKRASNHFTRGLCLVTESWLSVYVFDDNLLLIRSSGWQGHDIQVRDVNKDGGQKFAFWSKFYFDSDLCQKLEQNKTVRINKKKRRKKCWEYISVGYMVYIIKGEL